MADKYIKLNNGVLTNIEATDTSTGVSEAGDIVALDSTGKLDLSLFPTGIGPATKTVTVGADVTAGQFVNLYNDSGLKVRPADSTNSRPAHGFVLDTVAAAGSVAVYFEGINNARSGLTIGARYYLSSGGGVQSTAPATPTDQIHQYLGIATAATEIESEVDDYIVL